MSASMMYLFAAFAVVWVALFGYLMYVSNRITALQQQVDQLLGEQAEEQQQANAAPTPRPGPAPARAEHT